MWTKENVGKAVTEIVGARLGTGERETLKDMIWETIETQKDVNDIRTRAVIDFLQKSGKIELTHAFRLADLLG